MVNSCKECYYCGSIVINNESSCMHPKALAVLIHNNGKPINVIEDFKNCSYVKE